MKPTRFTQDMIDEYVRMGYWGDNLISDYWDRNAASLPNMVALVEEDVRITWAESKKHIDNIAASLIELGIKRDEKVAVQLHNCIELFTFRLACEKAGVVAVTLLPNFREAEVSAILKYTEAAGIVIPHEFRQFNYVNMIKKLSADLPALRHVFVIGDDVPEGAISVKEMASQKVGHPPDNFEKTRFSPFETFQIATTTGTTGMPKCVEFVSAVRQCTGKVIKNRLKITENDVVGAFAPAIAGGCYNEVYRASPMAGAKIVLAKYFTPEEILTLIEKEKVTVIATVPTILIRILELPDFEKYDVSSIRIVKYGGAALPYDQGLKVWERFKRPGLPAYGTLDAGTMSSSFCDDTKEKLLTTVGVPLDGNVCKLVDERGQEVPKGEVGEVIVNGPHCQPGYYRDPEATQNAWSDGWFHTGDLGSFDDEGRLTIRGRRKDMILRGGQNIYPLEVEGILLQHPKILKAAVVGIPDPKMGEKVCGCLVLKEGETLNLAEILHFFKEKGVAAFKIPERIELLDDFPLAGSIKVDKKQLRQDVENKLRQEGALTSLNNT
ncbi:MAG TPA: AMP-binding protein [Syntrophorhabdaceae bacterium]|nr:AMP-binding protein [Syntrophorhabdaceae bacterium]HQM81632.1 AMP-binding protein [Syntrophorhabdaceae bacterium]